MKTRIIKPIHEKFRIINLEAEERNQESKSRKEDVKIEKTKRFPNDRITEEFDQNGEIIMVLKYKSIKI